MIAQDPEQWRFGVYILAKLACLTVDLELQHAASARMHPSKIDLVRFSLQASPRCGRDIRNEIAEPSGWQKLSQNIFNRNARLNSPPSAARRKLKPAAQTN